MEFCERTCSLSSSTIHAPHVASDRINLRIHTRTVPWSYDIYSLQAINAKPEGRWGGAGHIHMNAHHKHIYVHTYTNTYMNPYTCIHVSSHTHACMLAYIHTPPLLLSTRVRGMCMHTPPTPCIPPPTPPH